METSSTSREYYCDTKNNNNCRLVFFVNSRSGGSTRDAVASLLSRIERRRKTRGDCSSIVLDDYDGNETALKEKVRFELTTTGGPKDDDDDDDDDDDESSSSSLVRAVACGGDGTVSWTFSLLKDAREEEEEKASSLLEEDEEEEETLKKKKRSRRHRRRGLMRSVVPLGQLPLGTGNEFARVFGWNESRDRWEDDFDGFCEEVKRGEVATADLWTFASESVVECAKNDDDDDDGEKKKKNKNKMKDFFSSPASSSLVLLRRLKERLRRRTAAKQKTAMKENRSEKQEEEEEEEAKRTPPPPRTKPNNRRHHRNWSFSGHLRSPSELEEALVESIQDHDATTPHPSLPSSLFADPPLSPPGTQKTNPFVSAPKHARNDSIASSSYVSARDIDEEENEEYGADDIESGGTFRQRRPKASSLPPLVKVEKFEKLSACFFSVGFDAGIALQFHQFREKTEKCCVVPKTVSANVAGYGVLGALEWLAKRRYLSPKTILLYVDDKPIPIPDRANTIQIFNIHSSTTGVDFFGSGEESKPHERLQDFHPPSVQDGLVEVVATYGVGHLSAIRFRMTHSYRLAQGKKVEIVLKRPLPVQVDGEPWLNQPGRIRFTFSRSWPVVLGLGELRNVVSSPSEKRERRGYDDDDVV